jgi:hypothetical protein
VYYIFRPAILYFFSLCNNPYGNQQALKDIMQAIGYMSFPGNPSPNFIQAAMAKNLVPPFDPNFNAWAEVWFNSLFDNNNNQYQPKVIVQGGEAVNLYTFNKYDNVRTHDTDTRVLIGHHFNYITEMHNVAAEARIRMHRFRFLLSFGLSVVLDRFINNINNNGRFDYTSTFLPYWTFQIPCTFTPRLGNQRFIDLIFNNNPMSPHFYDIQNNRFIESLISLDVNVAQPHANMIQAGVVDIFVPYRRQVVGSVNNLGQSDRIHNYFSTNQAISVVHGPNGGPPPVAPGLIPHVTLTLPMTAFIPDFNLMDINIDVVPYGYILFETIRMLLVSNEMTNLFPAYGNNKFVKYKQKLNVLLTTALRFDMSNAIKNVCIGSTSVTPAIQQYLTGGGTKNQNNQNEKMYKEMNSNSTSMPARPRPVFNEKEIEEARAFSRKLMESTNVDKIDIASLTPTELRGYFDYLSYEDPDFKEDRLPLSKEDLEGRFRPIPFTTTPFNFTNAKKNRKNNRFNKTRKQNQNKKN